MSDLPSINPKISHLHVASPIIDYEQLQSELLNTKRSIHTRRVYKEDINRFCQDMDISLGSFLSGDRFWGFQILSKYKGDMISNNLTPATINRRLSAIKSLVNYAYDCGVCEFVLDNVKGEKLTCYRDTSGVSQQQFQLMLNQCDLKTLKGLRDYALLKLLWGNALRREEAAQCKVKDFNSQQGELRILGKGKASKEVISIGKNTVSAIENYLVKRDNLTPSSPLFTSVNKGYQGRHLSGYGIYNIVSDLATAAGIQKVMSPHRIRHSAITTALDKTKGDVRAVQKLSRHKSLNTLMIYDDNRRNEQGRITNLLDDLV